MSKGNSKASYPRDLSHFLYDALGETFTKVFNIPVYKSNSKTVIARWSKRHNRTVRAIPYWFGLKVPDISRINEYVVTHFAYICDGEYLVLLPTDVILKKIRNEELLESPRGGPLQHYHIQFDQESGQIMWILKHGIRENVEHCSFRF